MLEVSAFSKLNRYIVSWPLYPDTDTYRYIVTPLIYSDICEITIFLQLIIIEILHSICIKCYVDVRYFLYFYFALCSKIFIEKSVNQLIKIKELTVTIKEQKYNVKDIIKSK